MSSNEKQRRVRALCAALGFGASAAILTGEVARAQSSGLEEITVTARFREENLQETPLAITAFSGENMEARNLTDVTMLDTFSPNTIIQPLGAGWGSTAAAFIRGVGLGDNSLSFEPGVPIYIDDVYHGRPQGAILDLLDLERVEILRGPQGTLFGKNAIGGTIRLVSRARRATIRATRKSRRARSIASTCAARTTSRSCRTSCSRASRGLRSSAMATSTFSTSNA